MKLREISSDFETLRRELDSTRALRMGEFVTLFFRRVLVTPNGNAVLASTEHSLPVSITDVVSRIQELNRTGNAVTGITSVYNDDKQDALFAERRK
jgi:hypothetical protein